MSADLPLIAVIGATGQQGGGVVNHLLASGKYRIRGLTRNPESAAAVALSKRGVQVVKAHADSVAELKAAFTGAWAVYAVTNFWDPEMNMNADKEEQQGRNMADAAVAAKVEIFLWSGLHDAHSIVARAGLKEPFDAEHFTCKYKVEQYVRSLPIKGIFLYAGFYMNNFEAFPPFAPRRVSPNHVEWALPLRADVGLPMLDVADTGIYVKEILAHPAQWYGKVVLLATEYLTMAQIARIYAQVTGEKATSRYLPETPAAFPDPIKTTYKWFNQFGYYGGADLNEADKRRDWPGISGWEDYLRRTGWRVAK